MTKYLALIICFASVVIAVRLVMPLSPYSLAIMPPEEIVNAVFARKLGLGIFILIGLGMLIGFYAEIRKRKR